MKTLSFQGKTYEVDDLDFLLDFKKWDEDFAVGIAPKVGISALTDKHWAIIRFIRDKFKESGECPLVYNTCRSNGLSIKNLKKLFSAGYQRSACKLAGIACRHLDERTYRIDVFGFLIDPLEWDRDFAVNRAHELKIEHGLTDKHWELINYLRDVFRKNNKVPTIYECCEANQIELENFEKLFPSGYQRGLVKIAGLRVI